MEIFPKKYKIEGDKFLVEFVEIEGDLDRADDFEIFLDFYTCESTHFEKNLPFHGIIYVFEANNKKSL